MRITSELLLKIARDTVAQRTRADRGVLAVYLHGSLAKPFNEQPLLGGATDIDLFFIHSDPPDVRREIVRMTDDVHLDIAHHARARYRDTRGLRLDPWLGSAVNGGKILYDPQHFMDFTQASVRGHFDDPENVLGRTQKQAGRARSIWLNFQLEPVEPGLESAQFYLEAVEQAANAIACLNGPPLPVRRLGIEFPERAAAAGRPGLYQGLLGLLGAGTIDAGVLNEWVNEWQLALQSLPKALASAGLHPHRLPYLKAGLLSALEGENPFACLWLLLSTWTEAAALLEPGHGQLDPWKSALLEAGLLGEAFFERLQALDAYLDQVEETIEVWSAGHGITGEDYPG
jgi:hypothetical protein